MNRKNAFERLMMFEFTDHLTDFERIDLLECIYKEQMGIDKINYSDKVYLEFVWEDYKGRYKKNKDLYFAKFREDNFNS